MDDKKTELIRWVRLYQGKEDTMTKMTYKTLGPNTRYYRQLNGDAMQGSITSILRLLRKVQGIVVLQSSHEYLWYMLVKDSGKWTR